MGCFSPVPEIDDALVDRIRAEVHQPVVDELARRGTPFHGVLYAGLMLTPAGFKVLEFNVRFGDPECQPLMLRLVSDLLPVLAAGAAKDFAGARLAFDDAAAACIVLANAGYPGTPAAGDPIVGLEAAAGEGAVVFHAGTRRDAGQLLATGGRVLGVCASGADLSEALARAYAAADRIHWPHKVLRRDIGRRLL
jgi:phosphoribosylamine--glycine ligase